MLVKWFELDSSKPISYNDDTLALWAPGWIHRFWCIVGWKASVWMSFMGKKYLEMHTMLVYRVIFELQGWESLLMYRSPLLYIFCVCYSFYLFVFISFLMFPSFWDFCGHIFCKPSRDLTRPLGETKWFKGLVAYAKCNRDSYESELGL